MKYQVDYDFCLSSYLSFRYVVKKGIAWAPGIVPEFPNENMQGSIIVQNSAEIDHNLKEITSVTCQKYMKPALFLSSGIDSAIIAAYLPKHSLCYTIKFDAENAIDESIRAREVADYFGLNHKIINVSWEDYDKFMDVLMINKKAPLHPVEVGLYKATLAAKEDGADVVFVGNGADSTFGGMDKLLAKDWSFDEFKERYTFLNPGDVLVNPVSMDWVYEQYRTDNGINVLAFLKKVHGLGIIQMFENAIHLGGCSIEAPFERLALGAPLDLDRIRRGEPKYLLVELFERLYKGLSNIQKIPFARPMAKWMENWKGPRRKEFKKIDPNCFTGEQKWQMYCLERFLDLLDEGKVHE